GYEGANDYFYSDLKHIEWVMEQQEWGLIGIDNVKPLFNLTLPNLQEEVREHGDTMEWFDPAANDAFLVALAADTTNAKKFIDQVERRLVDRRKQLMYNLDQLGAELDV
ncbi:MAG: hypothetical protein AAFO28_03565, partial [Pseudomonadota bacterium]